MSATLIPQGFMEWADATFGDNVDAIEQGAKKLLEEVAEYREALRDKPACALWHEGRTDEALAIGAELADLYMTAYHVLDIVQRLFDQQGCDLYKHVESKFITNLKRRFEKGENGVIRHV